MNKKDEKWQKKKWEDMNTLERIVDATDVVKLYGGGIWGDKYDKWLDKSNTKASGFAGKFLRVTLWLSILYALVGLAFLVFEIKTQSQADKVAWIGITPLILTTMIQILRHKYYGAFKLLWIAPIIVWAITLSVPICGILDDLGIVEIW